MCGRALGGHMRAHGIGDECGNLVDHADDTISDWEDKCGGNDRTNNKKMYQLRTNPNRIKSCRNCENCGKEFLCWKSFLEHGKCRSEDAESVVSLRESEGEDEDRGRGGSRWSKRKRSSRTNIDSFSSTYLSSEKEDFLLAKCLLQLANTRVDPPPPPPLAVPEEFSTTAREEETLRRNIPIAYFDYGHKPEGVSNSKLGLLFECKSCKKVFNSHQALGGHRASHKNVKGCHAANQYDNLAEDGDDGITHGQFILPNKSSKVHECSICHRVFSSGQALGGHKRCHWINSNPPADTFSFAKLHFHPHHDHRGSHQRKMIDETEVLDLNLPACADQISQINDNKNDNATNNVEQADSKTKLAKLSDSKDTMNISSDSSQWLQIGSIIDSATNP
ncbi:Zinc finger protein ZAT3 [Abeliophyllum distichum]|uniref:Zinc finger protein ZAT3 n=1 Tax=Abeliophyllum distichum TaxID=126358 RepID=A0ABD1RSH5_9LAMI